MTAEKLKSAVADALPQASVTVEDMTGTNDHFQMTVICDLFSGKGPVERQRIIFKILGNAIGGPIHALTLKTLTADEAVKQSASGCP